MSSLSKQQRRGARLADLTQQRDELRVKVSELGARLGDALQAVGLASTIVPSMVVDVNDPVAMMQRVVDDVAELRDAAREYVWLGAGMGRYERLRYALLKMGVLDA